MVQNRRAGEQKPHWDKTKAPRKRTQNCWPTTPNIVECYMLRPFAHPVACCWMLLRVVARSLKPVKLFSQQLRTFLLLRDRRSVAQHCGSVCTTLPSVAKNVYASAATKITWSISGKVTGLEAKSPRNIVKLDERRNGSFLSVVVLWFCCHCERSIIILVEIFSDMYCLVDNASWNFQANTLARSFYPRSALRSLDARRGHAKKVGNFLLLCLVQVSCNSVQQEII